ncbi:hypothetical protein RJ639_034918 [Escallonia herrerae]|uniref:Uncharacterized protein n=1 Tax=Escallonia herrerae TaxID=1293975 RepID=A0AA88WRP4_9ASTE|nr:hypothetical protein RJ639_034918 [Escallonia herrerae]
MEQEDSDQYSSTSSSSSSSSDTFKTNLDSQATKTLPPASQKRKVGRKKFKETCHRCSEECGEGTEANGCARYEVCFLTGLLTLQG